MPQLPPGAWNAHWISLSADPREDLGVFAFRRSYRLDSVPREMKVRVSADNRYKLYVNGEFVGFGPQRGDELHWFYEMYDLAPFLKVGENWIAALVWNFGRWAPMAQHTARTGFVLESIDGDPTRDASEASGRDARAPNLSTPDGWQAARLKNWSFDMMHSESMNFYIDIGPGEIMDFRGAPWGWRTGDDAKGLADWRKPNVVCRAEERGTMGGMTPWSLVPRSIPAMLYEEREAPPKIRRGFKGDSSKTDLTDGADLAEGLALELGRKYLFDYGELLTAYPRLTVSGPAGTVLVLSYAEGMWQEKGGKGNRNEIAGKKMLGYQDKIVLDGETRTIEPLWWRTYRYLMVETFAPSPLREAEGGGAGVGGPNSESTSTPLPPSSSGAGGGGVNLHRLAAIETGYPLEEESSFEADNEWVKPIWDVSVRTARRCAGETYFDCPYYEQLQYVGDTRIQALIGYYLGRDRALTRNAVETLGWSLMENGLTQSRYPSRQPQIIPPFSHFWVVMLLDQILYDKAPALVNDNAKTSRELVSRFPETLFHTSEDFWQFGDWVPEWQWGVPPGGSKSTFQRFIGYLAILANHLSNQWTIQESQPLRENVPTIQMPNRLASHKQGQLAKYIGDKDWQPSEHAEAILRVYQIMAGLEPDPWPTEALAKANAAKCTYYFSYYKHLAMFGRPDVDPVQSGKNEKRKTGDENVFDYLTELQPWKEMVENGLSTFAENPEPTRSDCHAWSAHPILGFFQIVAGVTSIAPAWKKARIDPRPGNLKRFHARIAHPDGDLSVRFDDGKLEIDSPVPFELRWKGKKEEMKEGKHMVR